MITKHALSAVGANSTTQLPAESVPAQRDGSSDNRVSHETSWCCLCGATDSPLEPVSRHDSRLRCCFDSNDLSVWEACWNTYRPHCPQWCTDNHVEGDFEAVEGGHWYHSSDHITVVFTESSPNPTKTETVSLDVTVIERVGGEFEPPMIFMNNTIMLPSQAEAFASALRAAVQIARIPLPS